MKTIRFALSFALACFIYNASAQFTVDGSFRTRAELRNGYRSLATDQNYGTPLVSQRSRVIFNFTENNFLFRFTAQDARVWGQNWNTLPNSTIHVYEAWAAYKPSAKIMLKLGRQELRYDDQRIMAIRGFSLTGATYDAAIFAYNDKDKDFVAHLGSMINNNNEALFLDYYSPQHSFKYMTFIWSEKKLSKNLKLNFLNLFDLTQNPNSPHIMYGRNTIGANAIANPSELFGGRLGGYYQFGESWNSYSNPFQAENRTLSAYSYNANIWMKPIEKLKVSFNIDTYSGHDWSDDTGAFTGFNRILAAGHAHLGYMDYFTTMDLRELSWAGIHDLFMVTDIKVSSSVGLQVNVHYFLLNQPYLRSPLGFDEVDNKLGTELDLVATYKVNNILNVEAAFMCMLPTETLQAVKQTGNNTKFSHFSYIALQFSPRFFEWVKPPIPQN